MENFFNTTNLVGSDLRDSVNSASSQDKRIAELFLTTKVGYTASCVWESTGMSKENIPITSVRRSLNTLLRDGLITKSDVTKVGIYGRPESIFVLTDSYSHSQTKLFL